MQLLVAALLLFSNIAFANSQKVMDDLFQNYLNVLKGHSSISVESVFTKSFIKSHGGAKELKKKLALISKSSPLPKSFKIDWKKGVKDDVYFASIVEKKPGHMKFVVIKEEGKFKIDQTINSEE